LGGINFYIVRPRPRPSGGTARCQRFAAIFTHFPRHTHPASPKPRSPLHLVSSLLFSTRLRARRFFGRTPNERIRDSNTYMYPHTGGPIDGRRMDIELQPTIRTSTVFVTQVLAYRSPARRRFPPTPPQVPPRLCPPGPRTPPEGSRDVHNPHHPHANLSRKNLTPEPSLTPPRGYDPFCSLVAGARPHHPYSDSTLSSALLGSHSPTAPLSLTSGFHPPVDRKLHPQTHNWVWRHCPRKGTASLTRSPFPAYALAAHPVLTPTGQHGSLAFPPTY